MLLDHLLQYQFFYKYDAIKQYFLANGYIIDHSENFSSRPNWFALNSTILFYHEKNKAKAKQISNELERVTKNKFRISRGAVYGLVKGEEKWKLIVHYIQK